MSQETLTQTNHSIQSLRRKGISKRHNYQSSRKSSSHIKALQRIAPFKKSRKVKLQTVLLNLKKAAEELEPSLDKNAGYLGSQEWTTQKDFRRCQLIDKEIDDDLSEAEQRELQLLQKELLAKRRKIAPLPLDAARKLHSELM